MVKGLDRMLVSWAKYYSLGPVHKVYRAIEVDYSKIEHRLFCHITQTWRGRPAVDRMAVVELD